MKFSTPYNRHKDPGISNDEPSLTKQSFKAEADINTIVSRYLKGGALPQGERKAQFGDFVGLDYREMQTTIALGNEMFAELPADVRRRFSNEPSQLMEFLANPQNEAEAVKLGLIPSPTPSEAPKTPPITPAAPSAAAPSTPPAAPAVAS